MGKTQEPPSEALPTAPEIQRVAVAPWCTDVFTSWDDQIAHQRRESQMVLRLALNRLVLGGSVADLGKLHGPLTKAAAQMRADGSCL
jgi:hypothetical protein